MTKTARTNFRPCVACLRRANQWLFGGLFFMTGMAYARLISAVVATCFSLPAFAQPAFATQDPNGAVPMLLHEITLPMVPLRASADRAGNVLLADAKGSLLMLDSTGRILFRNAGDRPAAPTCLEAWPTLRLFSFFREFQEFRVYDRFLSNNEPQRFPESIGYARCFSPAADENIWLVDDADFALKKVNPLTGQVLVSQALPLVLPKGLADVVWLKEYQNQVLLLMGEGQLLVFDNMANLRNRVSVTPKLDKVEVSGTHVLWPTATGITGQDFYSGKQKSWPWPKEEPTPPSLMTISGRRLWCMGGKNLRIYQLP